MASTPPAENNNYTLQEYRPVGKNGDDEEVWAWEDIATVELPPRAQRKTALTRAFQENPGLTPIDEAGKYRILDADSSRVLTVKAKPPEIPQLEITPE
jgi:hypothetical protein